MPLIPATCENPEADRKAAIINAAIQALRSEPRSEPLKCCDLYARVSELFPTEDGLVLFVAINWSKVPDAISIVDNGAGWYSAEVGFKWKDQPQPVKHKSSIRNAIPAQQRIKLQLVKFASPVLSIVCFTSRAAARRFHLELQMNALTYNAAKGRIGGYEGSSDSDDDDESKPFLSNIIIIATGSYPTPAEQTFFKACSIIGGPIAIMVMSNGDSIGLKAAKALLETSENGPCIYHARFMGDCFTSELKRRKLHEALSRIVGPHMLPPPAGGRLIANENDEVRADFETLCKLKDVSSRSAADDDDEAATFSGIGRSARELREAGVFLPLLACDEVSASMLG